MRRRCGSCARPAAGSPGYLALRERYSVMDIATTPDAVRRGHARRGRDAGRRRRGAVRRHHAAARGMGVAVELSSSGPVIDAPGAHRRGRRARCGRGSGADLGFVLEAIRLVRARARRPRRVIGICGGPFTLGAYSWRGRRRATSCVARAIIHREPGTWHALMERLTVATIDYVRAQVDAGADVIAVFDTWAASSRPASTARPSCPRRAAHRGRDRGRAPSIHSVARSAPMLDEPWRRPAATVIGHRLAPVARRRAGAAGRRARRPGQPRPGARCWPAGTHVEAGARTVLDAAAGRAGHIFNLGEAVPRDADPAILRGWSALVHDQPAGIGRPNQEVVRA